MAEDYTPTTEQVRFAFIDREDFEAQVGGFERPTDEESGAAFDRWLAAHDRQVRAQALRDAAAFIDRERQSDLTDMTRITGLREYWQNVAVGKERCVIVLRNRADAEERGE